MSTWQPKVGEKVQFNGYMEVKIVEADCDGVIRVSGMVSMPIIEGVADVKYIKLQVSRVPLACLAPFNEE